MRIRWTAPAAQDLYRIAAYTRRHNPEAARNVAKTIYDGCASLIHSPNRGRKESSLARASWCFHRCVNRGALSSSPFVAPRQVAVHSFNEFLM